MCAVSISFSAGGNTRIPVLCARREKCTTCKSEKISRLLRLTSVSRSEREVLYEAEKTSKVKQQGADRKTCTASETCSSYCGPATALFKTALRPKMRMLSYAQRYAVRATQKPCDVLVAWCTGASARAWPQGRASKHLFPAFNHGLGALTSSSGFFVKCHLLATAAEFFVLAKDLRDRRPQRALQPLTDFESIRLDFAFHRVYDL